MWIYEKKLEFPVKICKKDPDLAKLILEQYGGSDGELGASLRYMSQRFTMVTPEAKALLTDIATEELAHLEMIGSICCQLAGEAEAEEIKNSKAFEPYYVNHGTGVYPAGANGVPFTAAYIQSKGDPIVDLYEDLAAEQKARMTYEYLLTLTDDPEVRKPLQFLREREIVHFQRFGEALNKVRDCLLNTHSIYVGKDMCPSFDDSNRNDCYKKEPCNNNCNKDTCKNGNCNNNYNNNCNSGNCNNNYNNNCNNGNCNKGNCNKRF